MKNRATATVPSRQYYAIFLQSADIRFGEPEIMKETRDEHGILRGRHF